MSDSPALLLSKKSVCGTLSSSLSSSSSTAALRCSSCYTESSSRSLRASGGQACFWGGHSKVQPTRSATVLPPALSRVIRGWEATEVGFHSCFCRHNPCTPLAMHFPHKKNRTERRICFSSKPSWCVPFTQQMGLSGAAAFLSVSSYAVLKSGTESAFLPGHTGVCELSFDEKLNWLRNTVEGQ